MSMKHFGPGSQPTGHDTTELAVLQLPSGMETYAVPALPEPAVVAELTEAREALYRLSGMLAAWPAAAAREAMDLTLLSPADRTLIDQVLGEGEVSIVMGGNRPAYIQESVLAGVWRIKTMNAAGRLLSDSVEVGPIPRPVAQQAFAGARERIRRPMQLPAGVASAPALISEINEHCAAWRPGMPPHVINLTLMPRSEADMTLLAECLGPGLVTILSRGYGNCRITSTGTRHVWWVRYFNSQDRNILDSLEITGVPNVACAAPEDIADSALRLDEILESLR